MTLEEAKKNIQERMDLLLKRYREWNDAHPEWFASGELIGQVEGLEEAMGILDEVDTEPVGNPDKLTLTELAHELRKTIAFDYMTMHKNWCKTPIILLYVGKPRYTEGGDIGGWCPVPGKSHVICSIDVYSVIGGIQLLEYADESGNIDYSKCIVEVEE